MAYRKITAAEGTAMINDGDNIGFSGFTPNGVPKAVIRELSQRAVREHEAGRPFKVGIITGASSCQSLEGDFANAQAIKFRAPFSTNADFRRHANLGEIDYEDRTCTSDIWLSVCVADSTAPSTGPSSRCRQ